MPSLKDKVIPKKSLLLDKTLTLGTQLPVGKMAPWAKRPRKKGLRTNVPTEKSSFLSI